jgi:NADPH-ferrihemoprotein reductase
MARTATQQLIDSLDIIFLGTLGIGTLAWFARHHIADKFKSTSQPTETRAASPTKAPKKERNFVKVMQQQVR